MPELPEVETVVRTLRPRLVGKSFVRVTLRRDDVVTPSDADLPRDLTGRTVRDVTRRGKRIIVLLDDGGRFYFHLGMTGQLIVSAAGTPVASHTHFEAELSGAPLELLRFRDPRRFGGIWWLGRDAPADQGMGPEPLTLNARTFSRLLAGTRRPIKPALLDQALIAGLGNIYVDESLFLARIHPLRPANELSPAEVGRLSRAIKTTLNRAIKHRGSTLRDYRNADGTAGGYQSRHRVYDRAGKPCVRCRKPIERIVLGGRSTCFCPNCQQRFAAAS